MSAAALPWGVLDGSTLRAEAARLVEAIRPAIEYNAGRTLTHVAADAAAITEPGEPVSDTASRVLCTLTGMWVGRSPGCRPADHLDGCAHHDDWMGFTLRGLARETFGRDDGPAVAQVYRSLDELASTGSRVLIFDPRSKRYLLEVNHLGDLQMLGQLSKRDATVRWAWAVPIRDRLMAGGYQRLPSEIVRGLRGSDWLIWLAILDHPGVAALRSEGGRRRIEIGVGPGKRLSLQRLGLAGLDRPWRVRRAMERAAQRGNELQGNVRLDVLDADGGGLKFGVTRMAVPARAPAGALVGTPSRVTPTPLPRYSDTAIVPETGHADMFKTVRDIDDDGELLKHDRSLRSRDDDDRGAVQGDKRAEVTRRADAIEDVLLGSGLNWHPASKKQRGLIEAGESRAIASGCSIEEHLEIVQEGIRTYRGRFDDKGSGEQIEETPLTELLWHDDVVHPWHPAVPFDDPIRSAWGYATNAPLTPKVEKALRAQAARFGRNGLAEVANLLGDSTARGQPSPQAILDFVRRRITGAA